MALEAQPARGALSGEGTEVTGEPDPSWGSSSINRGRLSPTPNSGSGEEGALGAEHASKGPGSHLTLLPAVLVPFTSLVSKTVKGQVGQDGPDPLPALCTASPQGANDSTSSFMQNGDQASGEREKCPGKYPTFPLGPLWTHSPPRRQPAAGGPGPARELAVQSSRNWKVGGEGVGELEPPARSQVGGLTPCPGPGWAPDGTAREVRRARAPRPPGGSTSAPAEGGDPGQPGA